MVAATVTLKGRTCLRILNKLITDPVDVTVKLRSCIREMLVRIPGESLATIIVPWFSSGTTGGNEPSGSIKRGEFLD